MIRRTAAEDNMHPQINVRIARTRPLRPGENFLPVYQSSDASGMDVQADTENTIVIPPGESRVIPTGFAFAVPPGYELQVRPRSGLAMKSGVTVVNAPGTLDADYRGELMVGLINHGSRHFYVNRGDRIAQIVICPVVQAEWDMVEFEELSETKRGAGGLGSTGSK